MNSSDNNTTEGPLNGSMAPIFTAETIYTLTPWLFVAYIMVVMYKILKATYTWYHFKQQYKTGLHRPDIDLRLFTKVKAYQLGIKRKITLWLSSNVNTAMTFGFFKPIILLPISLINKISMQQAETLILHELSHIMVNDYLLNWFLIAAETLFFFNPFVLSLCKRIRIEREKYCDSTVITFNYPSTLYAETLLQAERSRQLVPSFELAAVGNKKQLLQRIQFFTNGDNFTYKEKNRSALPIVSALIAITFIAALCFYPINTGSPAMQKEDIVGARIYNIPDRSFVIDKEAIETIGPIINTSFTNAVAHNIEKIADAALLKIQPQIEKKLKAIEPALQDIKDKAVKEIPENIGQVQQFIPVALTGNDATRQIVVKEERSGSKDASVKVYELRFENGQWAVQPEWMISVTEKIVDSICRTIDTCLGTRQLQTQ